MKFDKTNEIVEKKSKFYGYLLSCTSEDEIKNALEFLKKEHKKATHICWAGRMKSPFFEKAVDDGEPSGTAGRPILNVLQKRGLSNIMVAVVRYFGGTKLGVPGLIAAYKESAAAALDASVVVERTVDTHIRVEFSYIVMNDVMRIIKEEQPVVMSQTFDNLCTMMLAVRNSKAEIVLGRLKKVDGAIVEVVE
jgi:uncharacterized YigZ family protein